MPEPYSFEFNGRRKGEDFHGPTFLPEIRRVAATYLPASAGNFLEWGSGISTLLLADLAADRGGRLVTVDHNAAYQAAVCDRLKGARHVLAAAVNLTGPQRGRDTPHLHYAAFPLSLGTTFDLVLIDGRRRVECAFNSLLICHPGSVVVLHDYARTRYQSVLTVFEVLEDGEHFRVMRPRPEILEGVAPRRAAILAPFLAGVPVDPPAPGPGG